MPPQLPTEEPPWADGCGAARSLRVVACFTVYPAGATDFVGLALAAALPPVPPEEVGLARAVGVPGAVVAAKALIEEFATKPSMATPSPAPSKPLGGSRYKGEEFVLQSAEAGASTTPAPQEDPL